MLKLLPLILWGLSLMACVTNTPQGLLHEADQAYQQKAHSRARRHYKRFLKEYEDSAERGKVELRVGLTYFHEGKYGKATRFFDAVLRHRPDQAPVWDALYYGALSYAKDGDCLTATRYLGKLVEASYVDRHATFEVPDRFRTKAQEQLEIIRADMAGRHLYCP